MLALVLGGNGFVGSHVVDELLRTGSSVRVFGRSLEKSREPLDSVEYVHGDFSDTSAVDSALDGVDIVYQLISTTIPATSNLSPVDDIDGNLINTVKLLDLMRVHSINRIVYLSSGGTVYGVPDYSPISETHPLRPICSYGIVKAAIENYLFMYQKLYGISYVVLRPSNPYGPRQGNSGLQGVIGTYINRILNDMPIEVWGDGKIVRDFIHVEDVAKLSVLAGNSDFKGCYNCASGEGVSILDVIQTLSDTTNRAIEPVFKSGRLFDVPHVVLNISKAKSDFGWTPSVSLQEGIANTYRKAENDRNISNSTVLRRAA